MMKVATKSEAVISYETHFSRTPSKYRCKVKVKKKAAFRLLKLVKLMNESELLVLLFQQHHSNARCCDERELQAAGSSSFIWSCPVPGAIKATEEQYFLISDRETAEPCFSSPFPDSKVFLPFMYGKGGV